MNEIKTCNGMTSPERSDEASRLKILVVNDDGINADGIVHLAEMACKLGDVWVIAPEEQCSGMSQKLTIHGDLRVKEVDFPVAVKAAWSVGGTPADCVKLGLESLLDFRPDYVFSGVNYGSNTGYDIAYSGTMGAALEAVMNGVPAIAFSRFEKGSYEITDKYILPIARELIAAGQGTGEVWNVNFPSCPGDEYKGILRDRKIAPMSLYHEHYKLAEPVDGCANYLPSSTLISAEDSPLDSDIHAVLTGYISIGKVRAAVLI